MLEIIAWALYAAGMSLFMSIIVVNAGEAAHRRLLAAGAMLLFISLMLFNY